MHRTNRNTSRLQSIANDKRRHSTYTRIEVEKSIEGQSTLSVGTFNRIYSLFIEYRVSRIIFIIVVIYCRINII